MAVQKPKPYTIAWPFTPKTAEDIDQSFDILFKQVQLNAPSAGVLPVVLGGTGAGSFVKGDVLYASTATTIAGLNDIATGNVLLSGGVSTAPSYGKVGLTTHVSGVLPEANGGTNQSTYAQGDLIYASAANTLAKLAKDATATRYLSNTGASNAPLWAQVNLTNGVTGTLPVTSGGTGLATVAQGDLLYGSAANTLSALAKNTTATRYLSNTGASNNPAWAQIDLTNGVTGALPVANAGTGITSYTSGDLLYATGATTLSKLAIGAANRVLRSDGTAPNWGQVSDAFISDVTEAKITDGTILARLASNETITGAWVASSTFTVQGVLTTTAANDTLNVRPNSGNAGYIKWTEDAVADNWALGFDAGSSTFKLRTTNSTGTLVSSWENGGAFVHEGAARFAGTLTPSAIAANQNDYNPTSLSTAILLRITNNSGGSLDITGLAGGATGRLIFIANVGSNDIVLRNENASSSASNRFSNRSEVDVGIVGTSGVGDGGCVMYIYDGTSSRWRQIS